MTTLLIQTENTPLTVNFPAIVKMTQAQFSDAPICPDFAIELRSASDTLISLQTKMQEYIDNGASLGWLIDRKNRQVYIYCRDRSPEVLEQPEIVTGDPELPGFELKMAKIW
jgi:Uma2 family endonuclease